MGLRRKRRVAIKSLTVAGQDLTDAAAELAAIDGLTATASELNALDGITADVNELNILDGVIATAAEINKVADVTAGAAAASKAAVLGANKELDEIHTAAMYLGAGAGGQLTTTATEINRLAGVTPGTAAVNKVVVLGPSGELDALSVTALIATVATPVGVSQPIITGLFTLATAASAPMSAATPPGQTWTTKSLVFKAGGVYYGLPAFTIATPW